MKPAKSILIMCLIIGLLLIAGCSESKTTVSTKSKTATKSVQGVLMAEIDAGKLVAIYDKEMVISGDYEKDNYLVIKNAYDKVSDFSIETCAGCEIMNELKIEANGHHIIKFGVKGVGEKQIIVRDGLNNYYGKAEFTVTRG